MLDENSGGWAVGTSSGTTILGAHTRYAKKVGRGMEWAQMASGRVKGGFA